MTVISVKFKEDGKSYYFDSNGVELKKGDYVLVETEKGTQLASVNDVNVELKNYNFTLKPVLKKATKKDYDSYLRNLKDAIIVLEDTKKKIMEDNIPMRLLDAMLL